MTAQEEYRAKLRTPEQAVRAVKSGDWVDYTSNVCLPALLDAALAKRRDELTDVKIRGNLIFSPIQTVECDPTREHFLYNSWHCSGYERKLCDKGLCNYIPMIFRNVVPYYRHFLTVNVAMMCVTPMDQHGYFNLSCAAGIARGILEKADIVILEELQSKADTLVLDAAAIAQANGNPKSMNVVLLGALIQSLGLQNIDCATALRSCVKSRFVDVNLRCLDAGMRTAEGDRG